VVTAYIVVPRNIEKEQGRIDFAGAALLTGGMLAAVYTIVTAPDKGLTAGVIATAAIAVALSDFRYWFGVDGPIQGRVIDVSGHPVAAAVVDAMNRDDRSVCQSPQRTVSNGGFVLDLEPTRGHAAYFTVKATKCELRQPITTPMLNFVSRKDNPNENSILLRLSCPGD